MRKDFAAVIFDFDGTLVHSEPLHEWAIRETVRPRGWDFSTEKFYEHIVGKGDANAFRLIAQWNGAALDETTLQRLLAVKSDWMDEGIAAEKYEIQPGAVGAVRTAAAWGPVAVCSSSLRRAVAPLVERIGISEIISALVCGDDVPRLKPAPDGYLATAKALNLAPEVCLAIEDTPTGVLAAKAAGMRVVAVCHTYKADALGEANRVVESIKELWV
jgi:beta-phosphoglucomutase